MCVDFSHIRAHNSPDNSAIPVYTYITHENLGLMYSKPVIWKALVIEWLMGISKGAVWSRVCNTYQNLIT